MIERAIERIKREMKQKKEQFIYPSDWRLSIKTSRN